ncbi:hypothetical protein JHL18_16160 [Clostridium sp. YIM B02505]|uniref:Uncharacterized protein n=1 Tax=Clostridium yunnanense TaxID=2800325 RepID=A0ABS1ES08_9CLOT|nr:CBO0543 family protein [Clostridium yunnanense]MBK1812157.1 hypothetical protein [Clostridium yunnanense]
MPIHTIFTFILIIAVWKTEVWKNWSRYYSTILFFALGDLMYQFLFDEKPLWIHNSTWLSEKQVNLVWICLIYPCTTLLLLSFYEKQKNAVKKGCYVFFWFLIYVVLEVFLCRFRLISYYNGWNFYWSVGFDVFMFNILLLHNYKPLWAMLVASIFAIIAMYIFL